MRRSGSGLVGGLGYAGAGHQLLIHQRVLKYELRGTMTKARSSSSASRAVQVPALPKAALQDGTYQPGGAYHTTHEARLDHAMARGAWNIQGLWGTSLLNSRDKLLEELIPDLSEEYKNWHLTSSGTTRTQMSLRSGNSIESCSQPR
jgi:hypothetical protein